LSAHPSLDLEPIPHDGSRDRTLRLSTFFFGASFFQMSIVGGDIRRYVGPPICREFPEKQGDSTSMYGARARSLSKSSSLLARVILNPTSPSRGYLETAIPGFVRKPCPRSTTSQIVIHSSWIRLQGFHRQQMLTRVPKLDNILSIPYLHSIPSTWMSYIQNSIMHPAVYLGLYKVL
jgi:hypothetical protein